jgi:hypothetical protein
MKTVLNSQDNKQNGDTDAVHRPVKELYIFMGMAGASAVNPTFRLNNVPVCPYITVIIIITITSNSVQQFHARRVVLGRPAFLLPAAISFMY